ncbi:MAG: PDZ domain-containing protein [Flavihumibacter sp.]|nr:PDZ domain-containing protein [Flavihumibacter sp.]
MKPSFLKALTCMAAMAVATGSFAQKGADTKKTTEEIVIKRKTDKDTKLTIEIKDGKVTINGKPAEEFKDEDISINKRKSITVITDGHGYGATAPRSPFRGDAFSWEEKDIDIAELDANRPLLGVMTEPAENGAKINEVTENSAASKAGLKEGDIITKINDKAIKEPEDLSAVIGTYKPGDKVTVTYKRNSKEEKATATLGKRKAMIAVTAPGNGMQFRQHNFNEDAFKTLEDFDFKIDGNLNFDNNHFPGQFYNFSNKPRLGIKAQETEDDKGLKVLSVDEESAAAKAGVKEGDIITSFDGTAVNNIDKLRELSGTALQKNNFKITVSRDGKNQELEVKIPKKLKTANL